VTDDRLSAPRARWLAAVALMLASLSPCLTAQDTTQVRVTDRGIVVDFQDADIRLVITSLAEAGRLNISYSDLPARRVTLRMQRPIPRDSILSVLRTLVSSNGLRLREENGLLRVEAQEPPARVATDPVPGAPAPQGEARLFVYRLRHAQAARLAGTLQAIFGSGRVGAGAAQRRPGLSQQLRDQRIAPYTPDTTRTAPPAAAPPASGATGAAGSLPGQLQGEMQIVPDEATNSLLVRAQPGDWAIVQQAIAAMDLRPLQVLIEVLIAEVRHTNELDFGVSATVSKTPPGQAAPTQSAVLKGLSANDFVMRLTQGGEISVDVAIAALSTRGNVRILSRPLVMAQNNQEAKILVGSQRPFVQVFRSLPTDAAVRDQVVQYRDVGTSLSILPTVNPDGYINLDVMQEVSNATSELQFGAPVISTREASTRLFVKNGQTAVLGGLFDRQQDKTRSGIPLLSSIPLLGALFGTTTTITTTSELFLFLTPHLVQTDEDMDRIRDELERKSEFLKNTRPGEGLIQLTPRDSTALPVPPKKPEQ
jgi:type II secretory pathway component GspD/PulD (secretin)